MRTHSFRSYKRQRQQGFTLVELLISMVVLTIGMVSLLGVFAMALAKTQSTQQDEIAKRVAQEAYEAIFTARETANVQWSDIENTGAGGIFLPGLQPVYNAGVDGIIGTADDSAAGLETMILPGPDGIVGTADDVQLPLSNYQRSISITPAVVGGVTASDLRNITITVQYYTAPTRWPKTYVLSGFISQYR